MAQRQTHWLSSTLQFIDQQFWLRHGLFWLTYAGFMTWLFIHGLHITTEWRVALRDVMILMPSHMLTTYALVYGVLPLLWRPTMSPQRFGGVLLAWLVLSLSFNIAYRCFIFIPSHQIKSPFPDYELIFVPGPHMPVLFTAGLATCLRLYRQWRQKELDNERLLRENGQAELQLLKAQVHPHFLFNTLNTLYSLTLKQSDQAPVVVERLTGLLHFVLEQGNAPLITLADEVALLRNYIALEQLRYGPRLTLEFEATNIPTTARIAPLLLLPLVENAFKHGSAELLGKAHIRIALAGAGGCFTCQITNTKNEAPAAKSNPHGIGLRNVQDRLQLLYPQQHSLKFEVQPGTFTVWLSIVLPTAQTTAPAARAAQSGPPVAASRRPADVVETAEPALWSANASRS